MVGGRTPRFKARRVKIASIAPAAVNVWPIIDLLEEIGIADARSPNTADTPVHSILSFSGVLVPWALM